LLQILHLATSSLTTVTNWQDLLIKQSQFALIVWLSLNQGKAWGLFCELFKAVIVAVLQLAEGLPLPFTSTMV
jgi:hypothetical protein